MECGVDHQADREGEVPTRQSIEIAGCGRLLGFGQDVIDGFAQVGAHRRDIC